MLPHINNTFVNMPVYASTHRDNYSQASLFGSEWKTNIEENWNKRKENELPHFFFCLLLFFIYMNSAELSASFALSTFHFLFLFSSKFYYRLLHKIKRWRRRCIHYYYFRHMNKMILLYFRLDWHCHFHMLWCFSYMTMYIVWKLHDDGCVCVCVCVTITITITEYNNSNSRVFDNFLFSVGFFFFII